MTNTITARRVLEVIPTLRIMEGDGVPIQRAFPTGKIDAIDPFLLLDHMGPTVLAPGAGLGFPDHPHRGFETVTYLLEGQFEHRDSFGNHGLLNPGDVQWMTAGSGLVHSEMPGPDLVKRGGKLEGFQLWVNLPRADKMAAPRYQELASAAVPRARSADGQVEVKIIAGEALGARAAIGTHTPILYLHFTLQPGAIHYQDVPSEYNAFAYRIREAVVQVFGKDGDAVRLENTGDAPLDVLLIAGAPIGEPVARYGPFVMNTREELRQAYEDYSAGRMGTIAH